MGISLFKDEIPEPYRGIKVDPCAIIRAAMDKGEIVHIDRENQDCITGTYTAGVHEGTEEIRNGRYIVRNIRAYTDIAAVRTKSGNFVLRQSMVKAIGAAPLNNIPDGVEVDQIVVVCTPHWANFIGGARSVMDRTPPHGAARAEKAAAGIDTTNDLKLSMDWDEEAQALIRRTPKEILEMAIGNTEDYAEEQGYTLITRAVMEEQMRSIGMDPAMLG